MKYTTPFSDLIGDETVSVGNRVAGRPKPENLKELFSYRLNRLAHLSSTIAGRMNESSYGLHPRDWRLVGMLGAFGPMSLVTLARGADELDGCGVQLSLTSQGRALYRKVFPKAVERNEELLSVLSEADRAVVERALDRLTRHALSLLNAPGTQGATRR